MRQATRWLGRLRRAASTFAVGTLCTLLWAVPAPAQEQALSLPAAVELALSNNPTMSIADGELAASSAQLMRARSALLPRVDYIESFTRSDNPVFVFGTLLNQRRFG